MRIDRQRDSVREWLEWQSPEPITANSAENEPTKPSKPGFVGFVGSLLADSLKIRPSDSATPEPNRIVTPLDCSTAPERVMSWAEWKADALNRLFLQGTSGQPSRITAETILHGERMRPVAQQRHSGRVDT